MRSAFSMELILTCVNARSSYRYSAVASNRWGMSNDLSAGFFVDLWGEQTHGDVDCFERSGMHRRYLSMQLVYAITQALTLLRQSRVAFRVMAEDGCVGHSVHIRGS